MLGKQLKLFTISQVGRQRPDPVDAEGGDRPRHPGDLIKDELLKRGYQPVYTPHIGRLELYRTSGHFPVLPRRPVSADVLTARRPARSTCASTAWPLGELDDEAASTNVRSYMKLAHFAAAGLRARRRPQDDKLEAVHQFVAAAAEGACDVELPDYRKARRLTRSGPRRC